MYNVKYGNETERNETNEKEKEADNRQRTGEMRMMRMHR